MVVATCFDLLDIAGAYPKQLVAEAESGQLTVVDKVADMALRTLPPFG
jgi:hypothetical protein